MKKTISTIILLVLTPFLFFGQNWKTKTGTNKFDGDYKTTYVTGVGGQYPYTSPRLTINRFKNSNSLNIYLSNIGYTGCLNNNVQIIFDNDTIQYESKIVSTDLDNDVLFLQTFYDLSVMDFINKLKKHSTLYLRHKNSCGQDDYKFSLSGSSAALDFVTKDLFVKLKEKQAIQGEKIRIENEQKNAILQFFRDNPSPHLADSVSINMPIVSLSANEDKTIHLYKSIFDNDPISFDIKKGDDVVLLNYNKMKFVYVQLPNGERWLTLSEILSILNNGYYLLNKMQKEKYSLIMPPLENYSTAKLVTKTSSLKLEPFSGSGEININADKGTTVKVYPYQYDQYILIGVKEKKGFIRNTKYNLEYE